MASARQFPMSQESPSQWITAGRGQLDPVTEADRGPGGSARGAARDGSRARAVRTGGLGAVLRNSGAFGYAIAGIGAIAALLMVLTEFTTVVSIDVASGSCEV